MNKEQFISKVEDEIIGCFLRKRREPELLNNTFAQFIIVGKIDLAEELEIIDSETAKKLIALAKGCFKDEILKYYDALQPTDTVSLSHWLNLDYSVYSEKASL